MKYEVWHSEELVIGVPSVGGELSKGLERSHEWLAVFNTSGEAGLR